MPENKNGNESLERIMNQLADSVLALSDEAIVAELKDSGRDPVEEAEKTGNVLRQASRVLDQVTERLSGLGHSVNANYWWRDHSAYHNSCLKCGMPVSFRTKTGEMLGGAGTLPCAAKGEYRVRKMAND
jgi:hypothetical protein